MDWELLVPSPKEKLEQSLGGEAFTYEDGAFIKRINVLPDALEIRSDNMRDYPSFVLDGPKLERFHPIGRVVRVGRTL